MGNYSLVANSTFKAKDFDEMIKPYMMYTADYNAQEEALSELATKADIWQGLANEQTDPVAYAQYTNYANALKDQAAIIASGGLNPTSRQTLLNLKRRYASEITPIETAYNTRKAQVEEQRKALLQNPTLLLSRRADTTSLDDYMKNPNLGYDAYSGALLTQQVGQAAANIAKELRNYGKGIALDGFTKTWLQQHGYSASEVAFAINHPDDPRASKVLNTIVNNVMSDSGIANWADNNTLNQAYNYARQGLWNAVGQTQVGTYTDEDAKMTAQAKIEEDRANARVAAAERAAKAEKTKGVNPASILSIEEENNMSSVQNNLESWIDKGYLRRRPDGEIEVTVKGIKHANDYRTDTGRHHSNKIWTDPDFRTFVKNVGGVEDKDKKVKISVGNKNETKEEYLLKEYYNPSKMRSYMKLIDSGYDTNKETEFVHDYGTQTEKERVKDMIDRALGNSDVQIVSYTGKDEGYKTNGTLKKSDFMKNYKVLASKASKYGQYFEISNGSNNNLTIKVPGVHSAHQNSAVSYYIAAEDAYHKLQELQTEYDKIITKMTALNMSSAELPSTERDILISYNKYKIAYEDALWDAEEEQGRITRAYSTDNITIQ